jgi:hypothetical protein|tara:strand:+ start:138 stop:419 length:282 start_codon:yes stop_codon:yes gene_type:complete
LNFIFYIIVALIGFMIGSVDGFKSGIKLFEKEKMKALKKKTSPPREEELQDYTHLKRYSFRVVPSKSAKNTSNESNVVDAEIVRDEYSFRDKE